MCHGMVQFMSEGLLPCGIIGINKKSKNIVKMDPSGGNVSKVPRRGKPPPGAKESASHHVKNTRHTHPLTHGVSLARAGLTDFGLSEVAFSDLMMNF